MGQNSQTKNRNVCQVEYVARLLCDVILLLGERERYFHSNDDDDDVVDILFVLNKPEWRRRRLAYTTII